jgi:hypothetical protein
VAYTAFSFASQVASLGGHVAQFVADSVGSAGVVSAPTAGATVTWLQAPQNGRYSVQITYGYEPASGPAKVNNLRLQVDGTSVGSLTHLAAVSSTYAATVILTVTSVNWISLNAISADTGRYVGGLLLSKLG